jgi:hypothetical protein
LGHLSLPSPWTLQCLCLEGTQPILQLGSGCLSPFPSSHSTWKAVASSSLFLGEGGPGLYLLFLLSVSDNMVTPNDGSPLFTRCVSNGLRTGLSALFVLSPACVTALSQGTHATCTPERCPALHSHTRTRSAHRCLSQGRGSVTPET